MKSRPITLFIAAAVGLGLAACHPHERKATEGTGTATATVKTTAPANVVSDADLQQRAQTAADAASTPVNGTTSNGTAPANSTTP